MINIHFIGNEQLFPYDNTFNIKYTIVQSTMDKALDWLKDRPYGNKFSVGLDIETTRKFGPNKYISSIYTPGLDPYLTSICMLQVGDDKDVFVIDARFADKKKMAELLDRQLTWVGHNLKFEYTHIKHTFGVELFDCHDTMLVERNLYNGIPLDFSLKGLAERYLSAKSSTSKGDDLFYKHVDTDDDSITVDKGVRNEFARIGGKEFTTQQIIYGALDVVMAYQIYQQQLKGRPVRGQSELYNPHALHRLENRVLKVFGDMELRGMEFDTNVWDDIYENESKPAYDKQKAWLDNYVETKHHEHFCTVDLFSPANGRCNIQWSSSKQVVAFFRHLGFCPLEFSKSTKKEEYSVSAKALEKVYRDLTEEHQELVDQYLKFKEAEQACTNFGPAFKKFIHPVTGRLHPNYSQIKHTGRPSASNPNLLNIPSGSHRKAFVAPKDCLILNADYSGQESVVLANLSMDEAMVDFYRNGDGDLHSYTATLVFSRVTNDPELKVTADSAKADPLHKDYRQRAKVLNFQIAYGASAHSLQFPLKVTEKDAQSFIDSYFDSFYGLKKYFAEQHKNIEEKGYIVTDKKLDRRWFNPDHLHMRRLKEKKDGARDYNRLYSKACRLAQNYPIQGTAAGITKLAMVLVDDAIRANDLPMRMTVAVYDELNFECYDPNRADECARVVEDCMKKAGSYYLDTIPLKAECVKSNYWQH